MRPLWRTVSIGATLVAISRTARADEAQGTAVDDAVFEARRKLVSLTISPAHLLQPMLQIKGELAVADDWSVLATTGIGSAKVVDAASPSFDAPIIHRKPLLVAAGAVRYYPIGDFAEGATLTMGVMAMRLPSDQLVDAIMYKAADSVGVTAAAGFKLHVSAVTVDFSAGVDVLVAQAARDPTTDAIADKPGSHAILPIVAFDIGYTFL